MTRRDPFQAIADPNRRAMINLLAQGKQTLNGVASHFHISRPAISRHMKILIQCGLVVVQKQGRERVCEARLGRLEEVSRWVHEHRRFWTSRLDALGVFLNRSRKRGKQKKKRKWKSPLSWSGPTTRPSPKSGKR